MTHATPLASEQITQEDREAAVQLGFKARYMAGADAISVRRGDHDQSAIVQAFARHRIAALSASPAPSGSADAWKDAVTDALVECHIYSSEHDLDPKKAVRDLIAWEVKAALDPVFASPAPSGQGVSGEGDPFDDCLGIHVQANARRFKTLAAPAPSCAPGGNYPEIPGSSCAPGEVERAAKVCPHCGVGGGGHEADCPNAPYATLGIRTATPSRRLDARHPCGCEADPVDGLDYVCDRHLREGGSPLEAQGLDAKEGGE